MRGRTNLASKLRCRFRLLGRVGGLDGRGMRKANELLQPSEDARRHLREKIEDVLRSMFQGTFCDDAFPHWRTQDTLQAPFRYGKHPISLASASITTRPLPGRAERHHATMAGMCPSPETVRIRCPSPPCLPLGQSNRHAISCHIPHRSLRTPHHLDRITISPNNHPRPHLRLRAPTTPSQHLNTPPLPPFPGQKTRSQYTPPPDHSHTSTDPAHRLVLIIVHRPDVTTSSKFVRNVVACFSIVQVRF